MIHTLANDTHYNNLSLFLYNKGYTPDQARAWLISKHYIVKGIKYQYKRVMALMYTYAQANSE